MDFSRTLTAQEISISTASTWLAGREMMLHGRRDWWQGIKSTGITKRPLRKKGRLTKEFHNFLYER
jgi:hypothetical protein